MPGFVTLSCPTCGGKLEITQDIERFACGYCGNEHVIRRGGGIISLIPIADDIKGIKAGVDKTAAELAIPRIKKEIEELESNYRVKRYKKLCNMFLDKKIGIYISYDVYIASYLRGLYKVSGRNVWELGNEENQLETVKSLSDEDINFSLTHWNAFWKPKDLSKPDVISIYNVLTDVQKFIYEKNEPLRQKEAELEKMQQIVDS